MGASLTTNFIQDSIHAFVVVVVVKWPFRNSTKNGRTEKKMCICLKFCVVILGLCGPIHETLPHPILCLWY